MTADVCANPDAYNRWGRYGSDPKSRGRYLLSADSKTVRSKGSEVATSEPLFLRFTAAEYPNTRCPWDHICRGESDHATSQAAAGEEGTLPDKDVERFGAKRRLSKDEQIRSRWKTVIRDVNLPLFSTG